jgi:hypothetical protein
MVVGHAGVDHAHCHLIDPAARIPCEGSVDVGATTLGRDLIRVVQAPLLIEEAVVRQPRGAIDKIRLGKSNLRPARQHSAGLGDGEVAPELDHRNVPRDGPDRPGRDAPEDLTSRGFLDLAPEGDDEMPLHERASSRDHDRCAFA